MPKLLGVANEEELDHFLGDLIKKAGRAVGKFVKSPVGKAIGGVLKTAAKTALPLAGTGVPRKEVARTRYGAETAGQGYRRRLSYTVFPCKCLAFSWQ